MALLVYDKLSAIDDTSLFDAYLRQTYFYGLGNRSYLVCNGSTRDYDKLSSDVSTIMLDNQEKRVQYLVSCFGAGHTLVIGMNRMED